MLGNHIENALVSWLRSTPTDIVYIRLTTAAVHCGPLTRGGACDHAVEEDASNIAQMSQMRSPVAALMFLLQQVRGCVLQ